jgi:hypothetical protein
MPTVQTLKDFRWLTFSAAMASLVWTKFFQAEGQMSLK